MLAVGPIAILPSPVLAAVPQGSTATPPLVGPAPGTPYQPFTVVNGSVVWTGSGTLLSINSSTNNAILSWTPAAFNIAAGETFNFTVPPGSAILNKVGYNTAGNAIAAPDNATINGNLQSNGRVFVVANGSISVGGGAQISTQGLFLSTLQEADNFNFSALGNLAATGLPTGSITIGGAATQVSVVGNLAAWGGTVTLDNVSVSGDLIVNSRSAGIGLNLSGATGNTTVTGNLTAGSANGTISQAAGTRLTVGGNSNFTTNGTAVVTLDNVGNNFNVVTANAGGLTIRDSDNVIVGNSTLGIGGLTVTALNNITTSGTVTTAVTGNVVLTSNGTGSIVYGNNSTVGGALVGSTAAGNITIDTIGALTVGRAAPAPLGLTATGGNVSVNTTGALTLAGPVSGTFTRLSGASVNALTGASVATSPVVAGATATITASTGSIILPAVNAYDLIVSAPAGSISQLPGTVITTATGSTSTFTAAPSGTISLANANAFGAPAATFGLPTGSINLTGGTATLNNTFAVTLGDTNTTGAVSINTVAAAAAGDVVLGTGFGTAAQGIRIGGGLTINTNGGDVDDNKYAAYDIIGAVTINTVAGGAAGATVNLSAAGFGVGNPRVSMGQVNITAGTGTINVIETTTLNLGTIMGAQIQANSTQGDIIQSGVITINGTQDQNRFAVTNNTTNRIVLDNPANVFTTNGIFGGIIPASGGPIGVAPGGTYTQAQSDHQQGSIVIVGGNNNVLSATGSVRLDNRTNVSGGNLTVNASGNVIFLGGNYRDLAVNAGDSVQLSIRNDQVLNSNRVTITAGSANATSIFQGGGATLTGNRNFVNNGTLTMSTPGGIQLVHPNNALNQVVVRNVTGDVYVYGRDEWTIGGSNVANVTVVAGTANNTAIDQAGRHNMVIGDVSFGNLTAWALNGVTASTGLGTFNTAPAFAGIGGNIIQQNATTSISVQNTATFVTQGGDVRLTNNNNSFGRVNAATGSSPIIAGATGDIAITEYDTMRVGNILTNGTVTLTSRFGSIIEDPVGTNITIGGTGRLNLVAPSGSVLLGNASTLTTSNIASANITTGGSASIFSTGNITLGTINATTLTVTANNIAQNAPLNIFGLATFNATNSIALNDPANNFGPLALISATSNQSISVTEGATLNLRTVTMLPGGSNGTFTANSVNGDIIDSGLGFVRLGGNVTNNVASAGNGLVSLSAANGNITLDDPTSDIVTSAGVAFNARNVTLSVLGTPGATLALGSANMASATAGNLTVSSAQGNIGSAGRFTVGGVASFTTGLGNITLDQPNLGFGQLAFSGNQVRISEAGNMDILSSSRASGPVQLVSGGSIQIVAVGSQIATFGNTVALQANGDITLRAMQALGTVTLIHTGTANLSALRLSDLIGSPQYIDLGSGPFVPPTP